MLAFDECDGVAFRVVLDTRAAGIHGDDALSQLEQFGETSSGAETSGHVAVRESEHRHNGAICCEPLGPPTCRQIARSLPATERCEQSFIGEASSAGPVRLEERSASDRAATRMDPGVRLNGGMGVGSP